VATPLPDTPTGVIEAKFQLGGSDIYFRFQQAYTGGPPSTTDLNSIATAVRTAYAAHLAAFLTSGLSMTETIVSDLANNGTPNGVDATSVVGTRSGTALPLSVCASINFGVDRKYRGSKPRIYTPFGVEADGSGDKTWGTTFTDDLTAAWIAFIAALNGESVGGCVLGAQVAVSYYSGSEANPNPNSRLRLRPLRRTVPLVQAVTSAQAVSIYGSQRRRLRAA
jgi:hypothetical protein